MFKKFIDRRKRETRVTNREKERQRNWKRIKGTRRMPRLLEAKKDVVSCEKLRGTASEC